MEKRKLYVLGPPRLERAGQPVELNLRKALALLVYLAVTGQPQSRDSLATLLWPDSDQREARARLRRTLYRLGQEFGDDVLVGETDTVGLNPTVDLWLDLSAFVRYVEASRTAPTDEERLTQLTQAVDLYADDFLAGFSLPDSPVFDEWQFFQRESMRQTFAGALERLVEGRHTRQEWDKAIQCARRWLALDTLHEPAHRALMRLYAYAGQQAAALRQYQECARILDAELGTPPEDETVALYEAIRTRRFPPAGGSRPILDRSEAQAPPAALPLETPSSPALSSPLTLNLRPSMSIPGSVSERDGQKTLASAPGESHKLPRMLEQHVRFCVAPDGVRLAYATLGQGPLIVKSGNPLTNVAYDWQSPVWRHWWAALAQDHTLVRYDERGSGLSDWNVPGFSLDAWVTDLETVVNNFGQERFVLLGVSQGAAIAIAYAVRHPERVSHLALYGGYVRGRLIRNPTSEGEEETRTLLAVTRLGWGKDNAAFRRVFTTMFIPDGAPEQIKWFDDLARISASGENAAAMRETAYRLDVTELAAQVTVPTLVMHGRGDMICPFEEGRLMAALIPNARFVELNSRNHILLETEPAWEHFLTEFNRFIATPSPARRPPRVATPGGVSGS